MAPSSRAPCAACKYLRRRCTPACVFAPHFPQHCLPNFVNAHNAFGAKNVARILSDLPPHLRDEAVGSLCFDAEMILNDEINGYDGLIENLSAQDGDVVNRTNAVIAEIFALAGDSAVSLLDQIRAGPVHPWDISSESSCDPQHVLQDHLMDGTVYREMESVNWQTTRDLPPIKQDGSMLFSQSVNHEMMHDFPPPQQDGSGFLMQPVSPEMMQDLLNSHQMDGMVYSGMESVNPAMMPDLPLLQPGGPMFFPQPFDPEMMRVLPQLHQESSTFYPQPFNEEMIQDLHPMQQDSSMLYPQPFNPEMMHDLHPMQQDSSTLYPQPFNPEMMSPMDDIMMLELSHLLESDSP